VSFEDSKDERNAKNKQFEKEKRRAEKREGRY
jgi:hypothetical protein